MAEHLSPDGADPERVETVNLKAALSERYLSYALSTITARSLPDLRDGLKPVQRRILYAMLQLRMDPAQGFKKCARVVGDVIGKFHPHGDTAVYDAMVRMAQDFAQRYPLVDGQGNFGNIDGDNPAAMRYTESRLTAVAMALLSGLDEDTVDFRANYDGNDSEPVVLPAAFPNLLANGASGIAVGMATSIPPHNVGEIIDALTLLLERPANAPPSLEELVNCVRGPDMPTGGILIEPADNILEAYRTGRGSFRVRARWQVEKLAHGQYQIVVDQIPYQVQKSRLIERIAELLNAKKLSLLGDLRDESTEDVRLILLPKTRSIKPELLMEQLFKRTELESKFSLNMNVLDRHGVPAVLSLDAVLSQFLAHRMEVLVRRSNHRLGKIDDRLEIVQGYLKAFLNIDRVIQIIREKDEPKPVLMAEFELNERQAEAILNLRLRHLRKLEEMALKKEEKALRAERRELKKLLGDETLRRAKLAEELSQIKAAHSDPRRSILAAAPEIDPEELEEPVERLPVTVICSNRGWVRVMRGHLDSSAEIKYKDGDGERFVLKAHSSDKLLAISTDGRAYCLAIEKLPSGRGQGEPISLYLEFSDKADLFALKLFNPTAELMFATRDGRGFRVAEKELAAQTKNGRQTINLAAGDALAVVTPAAGDHAAVIGTNRKLLLFPLDELPLMNRGRGVILQRYRGASLNDLVGVVLADGMMWRTGSRVRHEKDLSGWVGRRAGAGRMAPTGFPKTNRFDLITADAKTGDEGSNTA